jgi:hypothetical protein
MYRHSIWGFIAAVSLGIQPAQAIPRKDVLECVVADGSRFVLTSTYDWFPVPVLRHASNESRRASWSPIYFDVHGMRSAVPASVMYSNKEHETLEEVCAHFSLHEGVPLAPYTYLRENGAWFSKESLPWEQLDAEVSGPSGQSERAQLLREAGIKYTPHLFGYIRPSGAGLVFEKPLISSTGGTLYTMPFDAVFQAFSSDGGLTWTEGGVTSRAQIFEMNRSWADQSFKARPLRLNGKRVDRRKD